MKLAIKTIKGRDINGNTTYTAYCQGKRTKQQKILPLSDIDNHVDIACKLLEKLGIEPLIDGGQFDDKTMFFLTHD